MACGQQNITLFYKTCKKAQQKYNAYEKDNTNKNIVFFFFYMKNRTEAKLESQCLFKLLYQRTLTKLFGNMKKKGKENEKFK